jgi:hypothetical protein
MSTRNPRTAGNAGNTANAGNTGNATGNAGTARTRSPVFSAEIEVYIKIKPSVEASLREKKRANPSSLPHYWRGWNLDLKNDVEAEVKSEHQRQVARAVKATIDGVLGEDNGWTCASDRTLREEWLQLGPGSEPRKWCT